MGGQWDEYYKMVSNVEKVVQEVETTLPTTEVETLNGQELISQLDETKVN